MAKKICRLCNATVGEEFNRLWMSWCEKIGILQFILWFPCCTLYQFCVISSFAHHLQFEMHRTMTTVEQKWRTTAINFALALLNGWSGSITILCWICVVCKSAVKCMHFKQLWKRWFQESTHRHFDTLCRPIWWQTRTCVCLHARVRCANRSLNSNQRTLI